MITYVLFSPGGNITALVSDAVALPGRALLAQAIMREDPLIEQVGFTFSIDSENLLFGLDMMGGEFCVNAARTAALFWSRKNNCKKLSLQISGFVEQCSAMIKNDMVTLEIPGTFFLRSTDIPEGKLVDFSGIRFVVGNDLFDPDALLDVIKKYTDAHFPAIGFIYTTPTIPMGIIPYVWVRATGTLIKETACGSGSIATCIAQHGVLEKNILPVVQPSGDQYLVAFKQTGETLHSITISGRVEYLDTKTIADN